ncbi:T9SS type A sorting domain-containing protein, partial [candidate division GN15 bacterium]|nr:T9SS type A sorting domain-containing protein [candidate division GN15 bacterium]
DTWSRLGASLTSGTVNAVHILNSLDEYLVGGTFNDFAGDTSINRFAVYRNDTWTTVGTGADGDVHDIVGPYPIGDYVIGGEFDVIGNMTAFGIGRYDYFDDTISVYGRGLEGDATHISLDDNNKPVITGNFQTAGGSPAEMISRYGTSNWEYLNNDQVVRTATTAAATAAGDKIWLAGSALAGDDPELGTSVLQYDGSNWFYQGPAHAFNGVIWDMEYYDNTIWVAGVFDSVGGQPAKGIARWNGSAWEEVDGGLGSEGFPGAGYELVLDPSELSLVVGGNFTLAGGMPTRNVAKYSASGWQTYNEVHLLGADPAEGGIVTAMDIGPNGTIYVGGNFDGALAKFESNFWEFVDRGEFEGAWKLNAIHVQGCDLYLGGLNLYFDSGDGNEFVDFLRLSDGVVTVPDYDLDNEVHGFVATGDTLWIAGEFNAAPFDDTFQDVFSAAGVTRYFMPSSGVPGDRLIEITHPSADDTLFLGSGGVVAFNELNVDNLALELSVDSGRTWVDIDRNIDATKLDRVPMLYDRTGDHCFIRATDLEYPCVSVLSDEFTILPVGGRSTTWLTRGRDGDIPEPFLPQYHGFQFGNTQSELWPDEYWQSLWDAYWAAGYNLFLIKGYEVDRSFSPNYFQICRALGVKCQPYVSGLTASRSLRLLNAHQRPWGGFCDGFSKAATLFFTLGLSFGPDLYPQYTGQPIANITVDDFSREFIGAWWFWQMNDLDQDWEDDHEDMTPKETAEWFDGVWSGGFGALNDIGPLVIRDLEPDGDFKAGHSVMPYRLESSSAAPDTVLLYVYDNNAPLDTSRKVIIDTVANTWTYPPLTSGAGGPWGGSRGCFPGAPRGVLTQDADFLKKWQKAPAAPESGHLVRLYVSPNADTRLISAAGDTIGNVAGDDFATDSSLGKSLYVLNPDQVQDRPYGFRITPGQTDHIVLSAFEDTLLSLSFVDDSLVYGVDRFDADATQTDVLSIDSTLTIRNPDPVAKTVSLVAIRSYADNEKAYGVEEMSLNADDTTDLQVDAGGNLRIENTGGDKSYRLRIRLLDNTGADEVTSEDVFLPGNAIQQVVPDFDNLQLSEVTLYNDLGRDGSVDDTTLVAVVTDVGEDDAGELPTEVGLAQNYPNPFNPSTTIEFSLPARSHVALSIINIAGQRVRSLVSSELPAGRHEVTWDGRTDSGAEAASGVYFYRLETNSQVLSRKMMLLK